MEACKHLISKKEKILNRWEQLSIAKLPQAQNLSKSAIRDHIPNVFNSLCDILESKVLKIPEELSKTHGRQRSWTTDYSLAEVMAEYSILKNVIFDELISAESISMDDFRLIDRFFDSTSAIAVTEFVALREHELISVTNSLSAMNLELETFVAVAAHDLRSPASTILGFADLISEESAAGEVKAVNIIKKTAVRMLELIDQLLDYSKIGKEHLAKAGFSLQTIANEAKDNLASQIQETKARINIEALPDYKGDSVLFRQLFQNLLSNSLKFCSKERPPEVVVKAVKEKNLIRLSIKDNGIGFDPKLADMIFEPFKRGNSRSDIHGSGLGLATVKKIVELHGGKISAIGNLNSGAEILIDLPM